MTLSENQKNSVALDSTGTIFEFESVSGIVAIGFDGAGALTSDPQIELQAKTSNGSTWVTVNDFGQVTDIAFHKETAAGNLRLQITDAGSGGTGDFYMAADTLS